MVAIMTVFRDFLIYTNGTYDPEEGSTKFRSGQAVKIIGWGSDENKVEYWIIENSWGATWGKEGYA